MYQTKKIWFLFVVICSVYLISQHAYATTQSKYYYNEVSKGFVTDPVVRKQVKFWEAIFQRYSSNQLVIHDTDEPLLMLDVIDFDHYPENGKFTKISEINQTRFAKQYLERYELAIERFRQYKDAAIKFGAIEQRVFIVYQKDPLTLSRLFRGDVRLRSQTGLADTFLVAANRARQYLPYMESVFKKHGLPIQLTRLPFVESMFNLEARSKVGASGIWQFMPETARNFMMVNKYIDERNNPYKATHGAARLFSSNFRELGSWPLAVTAYNHGASGMQRAVRDVGSPQLGKIILRYKSPSFGFASKNFYSEFIAAVNTYETLTRLGKISAKAVDQDSKYISLRRNFSVNEILKKTNLTARQLAEMNPCINQTVFDNKPASVLPINYVIRLPTVAAKELMKQNNGFVSTTTPIRLTRR